MAMHDRKPLIFLPTQRRELALVDRFLAKIEPNTAGCHIWTAARDHRGYGLINVNKKLRRAHRVGYVLFVGPIPDGIEIDHLCHTNDTTCDGTGCQHRPCVNPDHLEPVTHRENVLRGRSFSAREAVQTHCLRNHEFTPENTYIIPSTGGRICRKCRVEHSRAWRAANADSVRASKRAWQLANPEAVRESRRAWKARNRAARQEAS